MPERRHPDGVVHGPGRYDADGEVNGVGAAKLKRFAAAFLAAIGGAWSDAG